MCRPRRYERPQAEWLKGSSFVIKGTLDQVSITDDENDSIKWFNDIKMPATIGSYLPVVINDVMAGFGVPASQVQYVVHTGETCMPMPRLDLIAKQELDQSCACRLSWLFWSLFQWLFWMDVVATVEPGVYGMHS